MLSKQHIRILFLQDDNDSGGNTLRQRRRIPVRQSNAAMGLRLSDAGGLWRAVNAVMFLG
jgi:hypothetical protein